MTEAEKDMVEGYTDGFDPDSPEPSGNRSPAYHHGFQNGRDDRHGKPRAPAKYLRAAAASIFAIERGDHKGSDHE